jgi:hypothetical protein
MMKILNVVIDGTEPDCKKAFPEDAQIDVVNITAVKDLVPDGTYDAVYCNNCLQVLERQDAIPNVKKMSDCLREDGEMWVIVPAAEWIAGNISANSSSAVVQMMLWGSTIPFRSCYTLYWLRGIMETADIIIRMATQQGLKVYENDKEVVVPLNIITGVKHKIRVEK